MNSQVQCGAETVPVSLPANVRDSLVTGQWDFLGQLLDATPQIRDVATHLPYLSGFAKS